MMRAGIVTAAVAAAAVLTSCSSVVEPGPQTTEERVVAGASAVRLSSIGDLTISTGPEPSLSITAGSRVVERITSTVEDGVLDLDVKSGVNIGLADITYDLVLPEVRAITVAGAGDVAGDLGRADALDVVVSGAGDVDLRGLDLDRLVVTIGGAGSVSLSGVADRQEVEISGVGSYHGVDLESRLADVLVSGAGDADLFVTDSLEATVSGAGSITYSGGAKARSSVTGIGSVQEEP